MYQRPTKKRRIIKRVTVYSIMTSSVILLVAFLVFIIMGYRIDTDNGKIEQTALVQFASVPSNADVLVDGKKISAQTPTKTTLLEGKHTFLIKKPGYTSWTKTITVKSGTLTWLNYVQLIPLEYSATVQQTYTSLYNSLPAPDNKHIALQYEKDVPSFGIVDVTSEKVSSTDIVVDSSNYTDGVKSGVVHSFELVDWDQDGRYILVKHIYDNKKEWLVLDIKNTQTIKNITKSTSTDFDRLEFSGTSGNIFYGLYKGNISKLDISSDQPVSKALISSVQSFELYKTDVITYLGTIQNGDKIDRVVGLYREGDAEPHILRTIDSANTKTLNVATARYFDEDYVAISEGNKVTVLHGSYPSSGSQDSSSLEFQKLFTTASAVTRLTMSPTGDYVLAQYGGTLTSYEVEHERLNQFKVSDNANISYLRWLNPDHLYTAFDGKLQMLEFDGYNRVSINTSLPNQAVLLTPTGRYIYSIDKTEKGYVLQRVRLILP